MKTILCPCEDITLREVEEAIAHGYATIEDVKRYTGLATGSCQGRLCLVPCIELLAQRTETTPDQIGLIRYRPPVEPVPLGLLAAGTSLARREGSRPPEPSEKNFGKNQRQRAQAGNDAAHA